MKRLILICASLLFFVTGLTYAETKTIKITVDSLTNETDLNDNTVEKEVTVVEEGFSDLGIIDISASPSYVVIGSSINFNVGVKNYGTETIYNAQMIFCVGSKDFEGNAVRIVIATNTITEIVSGDEIISNFKYWEDLSDGEFSEKLYCGAIILSEDQNTKNNIFKKEFNCELSDERNVEILFKPYKTIQHMCKLASEKMFGNNYFGKDYDIGGIEYKNYLGDYKDKGADYTICGGAHNEDVEDIIFSYNNLALLQDIGELDEGIAMIEAGEIFGGIGQIGSGWVHATIDALSLLVGIVPYAECTHYWDVDLGDARPYSPGERFTPWQAFNPANAWDKIKLLWAGNIFNPDSFFSPILDFLTPENRQYCSDCDSEGWLYYMVKDNLLPLSLPVSWDYRLGGYDFDNQELNDIFSRGYAYDRLGKIANVLSKIGIPDRTRLGWRIGEDDCYTDWMNKNYSLFDPIFDTVNTPIEIPWELYYEGLKEQSNDDPEKEKLIPVNMFPLYYLAYTNAQYADYFADDEVYEAVGDENDRRGWCNFNGMVGPTTHSDIIDNDRSCIVFPLIGTICVDNDNNDDRNASNNYAGDLGAIANHSYVRSVRSIATLYNYFWETMHPEIEIVEPNQSLVGSKFNLKAITTKYTKSKAVVFFIRPDYDWMKIDVEDENGVMVEEELWIPVISEQVIDYGKLLNHIKDGDVGNMSLRRFLELLAEFHQEITGFPFELFEYFGAMGEFPPPTSDIVDSYGWLKDIAEEFPGLEWTGEQINTILKSFTRILRLTELMKHVTLNGYLESIGFSVDLSTEAIKHEIDNNSNLTEEDKNILSMYIGTFDWPSTPTSFIGLVSMFDGLEDILKVINRGEYLFQKFTNVLSRFSYETGRTVDNREVWEVPIDLSLLTYYDFVELHQEVTDSLDLLETGADIMSKFGPAKGLAKRYLLFKEEYKEQIDIVLEILNTLAENNETIDNVRVMAYVINHEYAIERDIFGPFSIDVKPPDAPELSSPADDPNFITYVSARPTFEWTHGNPTDVAYYEIEVSQYSDFSTLESNVLYDDFQDGEASDWQPYFGDTWEVQGFSEEKKYVQTNISGQYSHSVTLLDGSEDWTDYSIEAEVTPMAGSKEANLIIRWQGYRDWYIAGLGGWDRKYSIGKYAGEYIARSEEGIDKLENKPYHVKVVVVGSKIELFVDGKKELEAFDDTFIKGKAGLYTWETKASFDNVVVKPIIKGGVSPVKYTSLNIFPAAYPAGTNYYWRVRGIDTSGNIGEWSKEEDDSHRRMKMVNSPPLAPSLIYPDNNVMKTDETIFQLTTTDPEGISSSILNYKIEIAHEHFEGPGDPILVKTGVPEVDAGWTLNPLLLFQDDFSDEAFTNRWDIVEDGGEWHVVGGELVQTTLGSSYAQIVTLSETDGWDNYTMEADVTIKETAEGSKEANLIVRWQNDKNWYIAGLGGWDRKYAIGKWGGEDLALSTELSSELIVGKKYHVKVSISGTSIVLEVDGVNVLLYSGDLEYTKGRAGLYTWFTRAGFDNVKVTSLDEITTPQYIIQAGDYLSDGEYQWRASALDPGDSGGSNSWGPVADMKSFIIDSTNPTIPVINAEPAETWGDSNIILWEVSVDTNAIAGYIIECSADNSLNIDGNFTNPDYISNIIDAVNYSIKDLCDEVIYYFHVRAVDIAGNISGWSDIVSSRQKHKYILYSYLVGSISSSGGECVDSEDNVYVVDQGNCRIKKFDTDGTLISSWGSCGTGDGELNDPYCIVVDNDDNIYISDGSNQWNSRIQKFDKNGNFILKCGSFLVPRGIAINPSGEKIYVSDTNHHNIKIFDTNGNYLDQWESHSWTSEEEIIRHPWGIGINSIGDVYFAEWNIAGPVRVKWCDSEGGFINNWYVTSTSALFALCIDKNDNVFVGTYSPNGTSVKKYNRLGKLLTEWIVSYGFSLIDGIAVNSAGDIYVSLKNGINKYILDTKDFPPIPEDPANLVIDKVSSSEIELSWESTANLALDKTYTTSPEPDAFWGYDPLTASCCGNHYWYIHGEGTTLNVEIVVDLDSVKKIKKCRMGSVQAPDYLLPDNVKIYTSLNNNDYSFQGEEVVIDRWTDVDFNLTNARYVKYVLSKTNTGTDFGEIWITNLEVYDTVSHKIERKEAGGSYTQIAQTKHFSHYADPGLDESTEYTYRVKACSDGGESGYSNEVSATTLFSVKSMDSMVKLESPSTQMSLSVIDDTTTISSEITAMNDTGNMVASSIYDTQAEEFPIILTFNYESFLSTSTSPLGPKIAGLIKEEDLFVYNLTTQQSIGGTIDSDNNLITATTTHASLYAVGAPIPDTTPPGTTLEFTRGEQLIEGSTIYASVDTMYKLTAEDPLVVNISSVGVLATVYRIDYGTWTVYTSTFTVIPGTHTLEYASIDNNHNEEDINSRFLDIYNNIPYSPINAKCESQINPVNITEFSPEFNWTFSDPNIGDVQSACQILVALSTSALENNFGDIWDSNKIVISTSSIIYSGLPLEGYATYYWKVMTWDNFDLPGPYCSTQSFRMGSNPPFTPQNPLCEGQENPANLTNFTPEFSWTFSDPDIGDTQESYRLLVSTNIINISANTGDLWDSGKVDSSTTTIEYADSALIGGTTYYWKVMTWDDSESPGPYCDVQTFSIVSDVLPPRTTISVSDPKYSEEPTYVTSQTSFTLSAVDDLLEVGDGIGLGVKEIIYSIDSGDTKTYTTPFTLAQELPSGIDSSCVALWHLDEEEGNTAYDSSDNGNDGTTYGATPTTGKIDGAYEFNGFNHIDIGKNISLNPSEITIAAWIYMDSKLTHNPILVKADGFYDGYYFLVSMARGGGKLLCRISGTQVNSISLNTGQWYHVACTRDSTKTSIYVNGILESSGPGGSIIHGTNNNGRIGQSSTIYYNSGAGFDGKIDEVVLFNRALSEEEIMERYQSSSQEMGEHTFSYHSIDNVGNIETPQVRNIVLDDSPPEIMIVSPRSGATYYALKDNIYMDYNVTDAVPDPNVMAYLWNIEKSSKVYVISKSTIEPLGILSGTWQFVVEADDWLGHFSSATVCCFEVIHDILPPRTRISVGEPKYSEEPTYVTPQTSFTLTAVDDLLEIGDGIGLGVKEILYSIDSGATKAYTAPFALAQELPSSGIDPSCIALWHLDEAEGNIAYDSSGNGNDGIIYGATPTAGQVGGAYSFDGSNDKITVSYTNWDFEGGYKDFSTGFWAKINFTKRASPLSKGYRRKDGFFWYADNYEFFFLSNDGNKQHAAIPKTPINYSDGNWHHFFQTRENKQITLYVDGVPVVGPAQWSIDVLASTRPLYMGYCEFREEYYKGQLDEVAIYNRALSADEILKIYEGIPLIEYEGPHSVSYYSVDNIGNVELLKTTEVIVDNTAPAISIKSPIGGETYIAKISSITINFTVTDLTPNPKINAYLWDVEEATRVYVINGQVIEPLDIDDGFWTFTVEAEDWVGNFASSTTAKFEVIHDTTPPQPVTDLTATGKPAGNIELNWSEVTDDITGVAYYNVFRATNETLGEEITAIEETYYVDSSGNLVDNVVYYYTIQPVDNVGNIQTTDNNQASALCDKTPPTVLFISPSNENIGVCKVFNSTFPVIGTADDLNFKEYELSYAPGKNATEGFTAIQAGLDPVVENTLAGWDTTVLEQNKYYTLRLTAEDIVGNITTTFVSIYIGVPEFLFAYGYEGLHHCFDFGFLPAYIDIDEEGYSYITDHKHHGRIVKFDSSGNTVDVFGGPGQAGKGKYGWGHGDWREDHLRLAIPEGITLDGDGNMYVADRLHNRMVKLDSEGNLLMEIGGEKYGHWGKGLWKKWFKTEGNKGHEDITIIWPTGVVLDSENNIWVADRLNNRIQKFTPEGEIIETATIPTEIFANDKKHWKDWWNWWSLQPFTKPGGLAIDNGDNLYIADQFHDRVLKFSPDGELLLEIGTDENSNTPWNLSKPYVKHKWKDGETGGTLPGQFSNPDGIVIDEIGYIYVTDQGNNRVQKFDKYGNFVMVWGNSGNANGEFKVPEGITIDESGRVYVVDRENSRVQVFGLPEDKELVASSAGSEEDAASVMGMVPANGGKLVTDSGVELIIPEGAIDGDLTVMITPEEKEKNKEKKASNIEKNEYIPAGIGYKFEPEGIVFNKPVTITIPYEETYDITDVGEENLKIFYWNETTREWELIENSRVDEVANKVSADIEHFSTYRVMGVIVEEFKLEKVGNYPNPFSDETVIFFNLGFEPDDVEVKIYTISGRLIKKIHTYGTWGYNEVPWDGRDESEKEVANGTYLYRITVTKDSENIEQTKKLVIIK